jgi:hypothetical protein
LNGGSDKCGGIQMYSLITAAVHALTAVSPWGTGSGAASRRESGLAPRSAAYPSAIGQSGYGPDFAYRPSSSTRYLTCDIGRR